MQVQDLGREALDEARALLTEACRFDAAGVVAEEKLFGAAPPPFLSAALGVRLGDRLAGVAVVSGRWLRLVAVHPDERGRGVGTALIDAAAARARAWGATRLRSGDQPGNYLAPGIDARDAGTCAFLERRGFREVARNHNLSVHLVDNEHVTTARAEALADAAGARGYQVRRATHADQAVILDVATRSFGAVWAFELGLALANHPPTVHVAFSGSGPVAFACSDGNNRGLGWFGPAGTLPDHRGHGLGQALLIPCLLDAAAAGHRATEIAWIGPRRFYESAAGAGGGREFVVLEKELA
jgi:GNAT superfamily N-acetyltransferase